MSERPILVAHWLLIFYFSVAAVELLQLAYGAASSVTGTPLDALRIIVAILAACLALLALSSAVMAAIKGPKP